MTTFGICVLCIIFLGFGGYLTVNLYKDCGIGGIIPAWLMSFLITGVTFIIIMFISLFNEKYYDHSYNVQLYGLSNGTGIQGHTVLGTGNIDDVQYIFYNAKASNNFIKTYKVKLDDAYLKLDTSVTKSYLEVKVYKYKPVFIAKLFVTEKFFCKNYKYIFHMKNEDINMQNYYDISKY